VLQELLITVVEVVGQVALTIKPLVDITTMVIMAKMSWAAHPSLAARRVGMGASELKKQMGEPCSWRYMRISTEREDPSSSTALMDSPELRERIVHGHRALKVVSVEQGLVEVGDLADRADILLSISPERLLNIRRSTLREEKEVKAGPLALRLMSVPLQARKVSLENRGRYIGFLCSPRAGSIKRISRRGLDEDNTIEKTA
jgi:hypothetical protein